jgi:peptidylprolyl isomerase
VIAALTVTSALMLAACGSDDDGGADATDEATTSDATAAPTESTDSGLEITGAAGDKPAVTVPANEEAPTDLVVDVVSEGDGAEVEAGDWLLTNYLGQTWEQRDAENFVFDNSWDNGAPVGFVIGEGQVIQGWDDGLVGQTVGSRVALTIPVDQAYGGLEHDLAEDTLVFVVDVLAAVDPSGTAGGEEVADLDAGLPVVTSGENGQPEVDLSEATEPEESSSTLIIEGDGDELGDGAIINFSQVTYPDGETTQNSWDDGAPQVMTAESYVNLPGLDEALEGATVGSRVLTQIGGEENLDAEGNPGDPIVFVIDVIDTYSKPTS